jgi:AMP-binding enzyme
LSPFLKTRLLKLCARIYHERSLDVFLASVFTALLFRLSHEESQTLLTLDTLPENSGQVRKLSARQYALRRVRTNLSPQTTFAQLMASMATAEATAEVNQVVGMRPAELQARMAVPPPSRMLVFRCSERNHHAVCEYGLSALFGLFDLVLVTFVGDKLQLKLCYNTCLYRGSRMTEMLEQFTWLITQVLNDPTTAVGHLDLLTACARERLPNSLARLDSLWEGSVPDHFHRQAMLRPDKPVLVHGHLTLSYGHLDQLTSQLANCLILRGIRPHHTVAINGFRNVSMVWAIIGVLKAGASFTLMDPAYPHQRIINCLTVARPRGWIQLAANGDIPTEVCSFLDQIHCSVRVRLPLPSEAAAEGLFDTFSGLMPPITIHPDQVVCLFVCLFVFL